MAWNYKVLPDAYQQVEYIQTDGLAYINTGFKPYYADNSTRVTGVFSYVHPELTPGSLFGASGANKKYYYISNPVYRSELPDEYEQVEYLSSTGTQFIDTGYIPNNTTSINIECEDFPGEKTSVSQALFGSRNAKTNKSFNVFYISGSNYQYYRLCFNAVESNSEKASYLSNGRIKVAMNGNELNISNEETTISLSASASVFEGTYNMYLFAMNSAGTLFYPATVKIYNCVIKEENDILIRDYVCCIRKSDDTPGLYDLVTEEFYPNAGTGDFGYGEIVPEKILNDPTVVDNGSFIFGINGESKYEASFSDQTEVFDISSSYEYPGPNMLQLTNETTTVSDRIGSAKYSITFTLDSELNELRISEPSYNNYPSTTFTATTRVYYTIMERILKPGKYRLSGGIDSQLYLIVKDDSENVIGTDDGSGLTFDIFEQTNIIVQVCVYLKVKTVYVTTPSDPTQAPHQTLHVTKTDSVPNTITPSLNELIFVYGKLDKKFTVNLDNSTCRATYEGITESVSFEQSSAFELDEDLLIFASDKNGLIDYVDQQTRLYSFKIYKGPSLAHEFVPCYRKSDDMPGVFDIIAKTFLINANDSGSFVFGADIIPNPISDITYGERNIISTIEYAGLPDEYQQIEYLGATGSQYIKTFYYPTAATKFIGRFKVPDKRSIGQTYLFGEKKAYHASTAWELSYDISKRRLIADIGKMEANAIDLANGAFVTFELSASRAILDIYAKRVDDAVGGGSDFNLFIFASNYNDEPVQKSASKLYSFKILEGEDEFANYIPCYRKSDKVGGLYDVVKDRFYTDASGLNKPFELGPIVNPPELSHFTDGELYLSILDNDFNEIALIDQYSSLIWSDRYDECGDFELQIPYDKDLLANVLKQDYFCRINLSDRCMIIEKIQNDIDENDTETLIISGRSAESLLERRVITKKKEFGDEENNKKEEIQKIIKTVIEENIISPTDEGRKIKNFKFLENTDADIAKMKTYETYNGEDLYTIVNSLCTEKHLGFKLIFNDLSHDLTFSIYKGEDRTYDQTKNEFVVFSPFYDNLKSSSFVSSAEEYRNFMYVSKTEAECLEIFNETKNPPVGISRKEIYIDKDELKSNVMTSMKDKALKQKAQKKLSVDYKVKKGFECEIIPDVMFVYNTDYFIGDKVQLEDIYGNTFAVYISEVVITKDQNGLTVIPTFKDIEEEWDASLKENKK